MKKTIIYIILTVFLSPFGQIYSSHTLKPVYTIPYPGSSFNNPETTIAIHYEDILDRRSVSDQQIAVNGTISGQHVGKVKLADDFNTVIFIPVQPFSPGEIVNVRFQPEMRTFSGNNLDGISFSFKISRNIPSQSKQVIPGMAEAPASALSLTLPETGYIKSQSTDSFTTLPADFPVISVTVPASQTGDGYVFASNFMLNTFFGGPDLGAYLLILENTGDPVYYQKVPTDTFAADFKKLPNGLLAYWQAGAYHIKDDNYKEVDTVMPGNGYTTGLDLHDMQLLPNGDYLIMIYDSQFVDMSKIVPGGNPNAAVTGMVLQEIDPDKNVVFQWKSLDHQDQLPITDSNQDLTAVGIDYMHSNAFEIDPDGNILLSSRHLDNIIKINQQTGEIMWILGGRSNQFTFSAGPGISGDLHFYYQHDIRRLTNGNITVFDNHNLTDPQISRALEYELDEVNKTAFLVWEYQNPLNIFSLCMGDAQRLTNGNTMIGWGCNLSKALTEVKPDGYKAFEIAFDGTYASYRAFRFTWHGFPTWAPRLVIRSGNDSIDLKFSWNGATDIEKYAIYGGNSRQPATLITEKTKSGFETGVTLKGSQASFCYYRVMPINIENRPTQFSNVVINPACPSLYLPFINYDGY